MKILKSTATPMTFNFQNTLEMTQHATGRSHDMLPPRRRPRTAEGKLLTPKQIRARARRKAARREIMTDQELSYLYQKPVDEWDSAELAQGRPRNSKGTFTGPKPKWITASIHEAAMERYTAVIKTKMRATTNDAMQVLEWLINNDEVDEKGKYLVPPATKLQAAQFLIEHVVGKPTQRIESDVSVKLQGILGQVMVNPDGISASGQTMYNYSHFPGITMELAQGADDDEPIEAG